MTTAGKLAVVMFEKAKETYEHQMQLTDMVMFEQPDPKKMQNANNVIWYPTQQHAPIIEGWDLTGQEQTIIEQTYPVILGTPKNDLVSERIDDLRDLTFWERRGMESGRQQATELNKSVAEAIVRQGGIFYRSSAANGYDFVSEAQTLMNERQLYNSGRCFILNDRDTRKFASDLSNRETVKGRPEMAWKMGQIGSQVAEFDIFTGSYLPNITGGADPAVTVTGNQSFKPEAGSTSTVAGTVTNVDYRLAVIPVNNASLLADGDKITFSNGGTTIKAVGLADKTNTAEAMTFSVVARDTTANTITVYPKPIAVNDSALNTTEKAYGNINTTILNGATIERLNTDALNKTNLFFDKSAIQITGGTIPAEKFAEFDGKKVISDTLSNGLTMYMVYDSNITNMTLRYRLFVWYGITICDPSNCGVAVSFNA